MNNQKAALSIAKSSLIKCYSREGIVAGATHFNYYWARDSFYASWGALELKDYEIVKKNLNLFLKNTSSKGHVPIRIGASSFSQTLAFAKLELKNNLKPCYSQDKGFNPAIDPNMLLLITLDRYIEKTNDLEFVKKNIDKIHSIMDWVEAFEKDGLIYAEKYSTWQDMIKKKGFVLYTNVLYYQSLMSINNLLNRIEVRNNFKDKAEIIKQKINEKFYDKKLGYYIDFYNEEKHSKVFSSDGNFFAILFEIANRKHGKSILKKAEKFGISKDVPSYTNYPRHERKEIFLPFYLFGMHDYNDHGVAWTWLGCLHSMALSKINKDKEAKQVLERLSRVIVRDNDVYEVYEKNGKPLKRFFYSSEHPFAWSASFYILAEKMVKK